MDETDHAAGRPCELRPPAPDAPAEKAPLPAGGEAARLFRPDVLMIGATGRNAGKTELACRIIRSHAARAPIAALKATTVVRTDGSCPRGGSGCGVCSALEQPWLVTREVDTESGKDTARLLASGAREAYWLRVREGALSDGACGLLDRVPRGWASVCESNSLRRVLEPGLFLQVRSAGEPGVKASARAVAALADRVVVSDGATFDLDLDRIGLLDGQWALQRDACAVVIDDDRLPVERSPAREPLFASLRAQFTRVEIAGGVADPDPDRRLLRVLAEALPRSSDDWCLVASPRGDGVPAGVVNALFRRRQDAEAVLVRDPSGAASPLLGLFHRGLLPRVRAALDCGAARAPRLAALGQVKELDLAARAGQPHRG